MKQALDITKKIFLPLVFAVFIIAGILASLTSGYVEYLVVNGLFNKADSNVNQTMMEMIPFLIVFVFEITKIFLNYYLSVKKRSNSAAYNLRILSVLKNTLIFVSAMCTLIFTLNQLYRPNYNTVFEAGIKEYDNMLDQIYSNISSQYQSKIDEANVRKLDIEAKIEEYIKIIPTLRAELNNQELSGNNQSALEIARAEFTNANDKLYDNQSKYLPEVIAEINDLRSAMAEELNQAIRVHNEEREQKVNEITAALETDDSIDNVYISTALKSILPDGYSRGLYLAIIIILSIIVSICLEGIIYCSFNMLSEDSNIFLEKNKSNEEAAEDFNYANQPDEMYTDDEEFEEEFLEEDEHVPDSPEEHGSYSYGDDDSFGLEYKTYDIY